MRSSKPPGFCTWLLKNLTPAPKNEALSGDLLEEFERRRSPWWYRQQVLLAILVHFAEELRRQPLVAVYAILWTCAAQFLWWHLFHAPRWPFSRLASLFWWGIRLVWPVSLAYQIGFATAQDSVMLLLAFGVYLTVTGKFDLQEFFQKSLIPLLAMALGKFAWWIVLPLVDHPSLFTIAVFGGLPLFVGLLISIYATRQRIDRHGTTSIASGPAAGDAQKDRKNTVSFWSKTVDELLRHPGVEQSLTLTQQVAERPIFFYTLALGVILTVVGVAFTVNVQQIIRRGANQPQLEMANFYSSEIENGTNPDDSIPPGYVDPERNLAPFVVFYDEQGHALASTGYIDQTIPILPSGIFQRVRRKGSYSFTWEPRPHVRIAAVARRVTGSHTGVVLAGRSLRLVQRDEYRLYRISFVCWLILVAVLITGAALLKRVQLQESRA